MSSVPVVLHGGCACNKIRYASTSYPKNMSSCLCVQCRKAAGGPYQTFTQFPHAAVTWLTEPPKYFRSSSFAKRGFCDSCGSSLTYEVDERPETISIAAGSIDDWEIPEGEKHKLGKPEFYIFARERAPWFQQNDVLPRFMGDDEDEDAELEGGQKLEGKHGPGKEKGN